MRVSPTVSFVLVPTDDIQWRYTVLNVPAEPHASQWDEAILSLLSKGKNTSWAIRVENSDPKLLIKMQCTLKTRAKALSIVLLSTVNGPYLYAWRGPGEYAPQKPKTVKDGTRKSTVGVKRKWRFRGKKPADKSPR